MGQKAFRFGKSRVKKFKPRDTGDVRRGSPAERGYGGEWPALSKSVRMEEPMCRRCVARGIMTPCELVDHIIPLEWNGPRLDRENLHPVCQNCHDTWKRRLEREHKGDPGALRLAVARDAPKPIAK